MPNKPVGLVWFGLSTPTGEWEFQHHFSGSRVEVKEQSARKALELILNYLRQGNPEID
jgi:nicotinamide mononucleotide (NMN) deamidase PncC